VSDKVRAYMRAVARWMVEATGDASDDDQELLDAKDAAWDELDPGEYEAANQLVEDVFGELL
jgi:hypothetical protein